MEGVKNFVTKEFLQMRRDPFRLRLMLVVPVVQLILLGYAANLDIREIPAVVFDLDRSPASRALVAQFASAGYFTIRQEVASPAAVDRALEQGEATFALVIPEGFAADLRAGRPAPLQGITDGSDAATSARSLNYAAMIVRAYSQDVVLERLAARGGGGPLRPARVEARVRVWFNPELQSRWFLVPGILALVLMVVTTVGTAVGVVREKEGGTLEQLIVTPIRPHELILGKLIPNAVVGMIEVGLVLLVVRLVFEIPIRGSLLLLLLLCALFLMTTLGIGLFVSTVSRTQQQAMMSAIFFVFLPMMLLSGFVFPIENMPAVIQAFTYVIPLRYFFTIVRGLFLKGVGLEVLWDEALALAVFGVAILGLSMLRFRKRLA
jgi:ABC-2 type transport system permease protein